MVRKILRWTDLIACLVLVGLAARFGARTTIWYAGLLLSAVSLPLWIVARRQLGIAFSVRPEARHLVTRGLYSKIRHPIYLFGSFAYFGSLLALQVWPILVAWLALTPIEIVRARREDRLLAEAFGPSTACTGARRGSDPSCEGSTASNNEGAGQGTARMARRRSRHDADEEEEEWMSRPRRRRARAST